MVDIFVVILYNIERGIANLKHKMIKLDQNRKVAISALSLFIVSFSMMLFFLGNGSLDLEDVKTDVLKGSHAEEAEHTEKVRQSQEDEQVEGIKEHTQEATEEKKTWMKSLYPAIKELKDDKTKLLVDKITFATRNL